MEDANPDVQIIFTSETDDDNDFWQEQCRQLLNTLQTTVGDQPDGIRPVQNAASGDGSKAGAVELFSTMLLSASTVAPLFDRGWDIFKDFLNRHQSCQATLRMPDGSEVQLNNLTKEEALSIYRDGMASAK